MTDINLYGRVFIRADIMAVTGLHIGGSSAGLEIGGLDNAVIRNPLDSKPYIPGSSLKGKMRSQTEKIRGMHQNSSIGPRVTIHSCENEEEYQQNGGCPVCHVFGISANAGVEPTRLLVRDTPLSDKSAEELDKANTDLRYAELKTEVAIDRVTSAATPRNLERVPAGAVFGPAELVFGIYEQADFARLKVVIDALQQVEDDYIGGSGSRGSGKVRFADLEVFARACENYSEQIAFKTFESVQDLADAFDELLDWLNSTVPVE
jgi:CRISPR-associated protein Csm3